MRKFTRDTPTGICSHTSDDQWKHPAVPVPSDLRRRQQGAGPPPTLLLKSQSAYIVPFFNLVFVFLFDRKRREKCFNTCCFLSVKILTLTERNCSHTHTHTPRFGQLVCWRESRGPAATGERESSRARMRLHAPKEQKRLETRRDSN